MDLLLWLVPIAVIVIGACTYRRQSRWLARRPGSFAWWQRLRRENRGWWY